jgi:hypothetical protein
MMAGRGTSTRKYAAKTRGRPFKPGNPGKPQGARHHMTLLAEQLMADDVEAVVAKVVKAAKAGSMPAAKLILDRVAPPRKGRPMTIALPDVSTPSGVTTALAAVVKAMADGMISTDEAAAVAGVIEMQRRAIETEQIEARLLAIEESLKSR